MPFCLNYHQFSNKNLVFLLFLIRDSLVDNPEQLNASLQSNREGIQTEIIEEKWFETCLINKHKGQNPAILTGHGMQAVIILDDDQNPQVLHDFYSPLSQIIWTGRDELLIKVGFARTLSDVGYVSSVEFSCLQLFR